MKKIMRMVLFSLTAVYLTSLWNKGFIIDPSWEPYLQTTALIALAYYLVIPISKIVLLPLNFFTMGLLSTLLNILLFHLLDQALTIIQIKPWVLTNLSFFGITVGQLQFSYVGNLLLISFSVSAIISMLERTI